MSMEKCPVCGNLVFTNDSHAKMSDLMMEMYGFIRDVCELHPYVLTNTYIPEWQITDHSTPAERYAERMRELGIEVSNA